MKILMKVKKIDHVVVLMLENHSFDSMLGWLYNNETEKQIKVVGNINESDPKFYGLNFTYPVANLKPPYSNSYTDDQKKYKTRSSRSK